jgi:hypothetical protein
MSRQSAIAAVVMLAACLASGTATAREAVVEGVRFVPSLQAGDTPLTLNNAGLLRYRVVIKAYVAALYLGEGVAPSAVLSDVPKRLEAEYFWALDGEDFGPVTLQGISRNVDAATLERLRPRIERFGALFVDVKPGDRYALTYLPGRGTEVAHNGRPLGVIEGADFAAALFAVWLGPDPLDEDLKVSLLARR